MLRLTFIALYLAPSLLFAGGTRTVRSDELDDLLQKGEWVKIVLKSATYGEGRVEDVTKFDMQVNISKSDNPAELRTGLQRIPFDRLGSLTASVTKGNKRTWLPVILCASLGTLSFVAAGGSEELKPKTIPAAVGFTVGLGVGGYYVGRAADRQSITYIVKDP